MPEENQPEDRAAKAEPLLPAVDDVYNIVKKKLDELQINTVVLVDNDLGLNLEAERWAECVDAIREVDENLLHKIEGIVNNYGTGNIEDYPNSRALLEIVGVIAASDCDIAKGMLSQPGSEKALATLEGYLRELKLEVKKYWKIEDVPKNEKLYFIDFRMQSDPESHGVDASHLLREIISGLSESVDPPGAVLMSRSENERPAASDLEHIAREGGGFLRSNFRYLDKVETLRSKKRFLFLLNDLLSSLPLGGQYFARVRALRKAAQATVANVAAETCGLLPADFRLFAEAVGGTGLELRAKMGDHLLTLFTGLLAAELRNDKTTQASLDAFFDMLMDKPGMAPGEVESHTLHRIHSRLLYDCSDWIKNAPTGFGDIYKCYRKRNSFYIVITPECDLELHPKKPGRAGPKANAVVLLRGDIRDKRPLDDERGDVVVTPLVVDPQTDRVRWVYWQLRAPAIVPLKRLASGSRRFKKWGRLRMQEAEEIQMRYATDLLTVGTEDLPDRVEKRNAVFWRLSMNMQTRIIDEVKVSTFDVMEIVNPKEPNEIYWALSEDCEHFLCSDDTPVVPAEVILKLRSYQVKKDFIELLRPHGIRIAEGSPRPQTSPKQQDPGAEAKRMVATAGRPDVATVGGESPRKEVLREAGSAAISTQQEATVSRDINFGWFVSKNIPGKWGGPTGRAQAPQDSEAVDETTEQAARSGDLPIAPAAISSNDKPVAADVEEPNVGTQPSTQSNDAPTAPAPSPIYKPDKEIKEK